MITFTSRSKSLQSPNSLAVLFYHQKCISSLEIINIKIVCQFSFCCLYNTYQQQRTQSTYNACVRMESSKLIVSIRNTHICLLVQQGSFFGDSYLIICCITVLHVNMRLLRHANHEKKLLRNFYNLAKCSEDWQMLFNTSKYNIIQVGFNNNDYIYEMNSVTLKIVTKKRDLEHGQTRCLNHPINVPNQRKGKIK